LGTFLWQRVKKEVTTLCEKLQEKGLLTSCHKNIPITKGVISRGVISRPGVMGILFDTNGLWLVV
jgi:hypothetical protein